MRRLRHPDQHAGHEEKEEVACVRAVEKNGGMSNCGTGDIIVDSAADESYCPVGQGDFCFLPAAPFTFTNSTLNKGSSYARFHLTLRFHPCTLVTDIFSSSFAFS